MTPETVLIRQIHPSFVQDGRPTSQAFHPTPKDKGELSVYDGDQIDAEPAWRHYMEALGHASAGAMGLLVAECDEIDLDVRPDPKPFPEHAVIDFTSISSKHRRTKAKQLKAKAIERDWLYQA